MKITIDLPDDVIEQLRKENAERSPLLRVETLAAWYVMFGMRQWHGWRDRQEAERPQVEQPDRL